MTTGIGGPLVCPLTVERDGQLEAIGRCLELAADGHGQVITVVGEAGIGKSRVAREVAVRAERLGWLTLEGRCTELDRPLALALIADLLRSSCAALGPEDVARLLGDDAAQLTKLLPELPFASGIAPAPFGPAEERQRLLQALTQLFTRTCEPHPLLLKCEDIHWSDDASLDFLLHLARNMAKRPMALLVTYRADEKGLALGRFLASLDRERLTTEVTLGPLTRGGLAAMVRAIFALEGPVPTAFLDRLHALTEGNPFFIEEVLKALIMQGDLPLDPDAWDDRLLDALPIPRSVRETVERRIVRLTPGARHLLELAAVVGRRFEFDLLRELVHVSEHEMINRLRELTAAQLVVEEAAERFAFRHALSRQAVYSRLLKRERRLLHRKVAGAMERIYAHALDQHAADLADHFYQAGVWGRALEYAQRLGDRAQMLHTPRVAIDCFTWALEAARHLGTAEPATLYRARGQAFEAAGEFDRARLDYEQALKAARAAGDDAAQWQALIDLGFLWCSRDYDRAGDYFRSALDLARRLDNRATLGHSLNRLGNWHMNREEIAEALRCHEEALRISRHSGDRRGTAETLDLLGMTAGVSGDAARAVAYYQEAASLLRELDDRQGLVSVLATLTSVGGSYETDTIVPGMTSAEAVRAGEQALQLARGIGWRAGETYALVTLAFCLGPLGEYTRAFAMGQAASALAEEIGHQQWLSGAHCALGALYLDVLAAPLAREHLERALTLAGEVGSVVWARQAAAPLASAQVSEQRDALTGRLFQSAFGAAEALTVYLGDRLGFYRALAQGGPKTATELAALTGTAERPVREWLEQQAAAGILEVDDAGGEETARRYHLPVGHAEVLLDANSLSYMTPLLRFLPALPVPAIAESFKSGKGVPWSAYGADAREGQAGMNRPHFLQFMGSEWLPAIPDIHARLMADPPARVADIGCGAGWSSIAIAKAYPKVQIDGFDLDETAIEMARRNAADQGLAERVHFEARDAADPSLSAGNRGPRRSRDPAR